MSLLGFQSEIHVWTMGGDIVYTLSGHTSFVYSLSVLPNGDIVSSGEDRTVRIWKGMRLIRSTTFYLINTLLRWRALANYCSPCHISLVSLYDDKR